MAGKARQPGPSSDRVAANLRRIRREKNLSAAELSKKLAELGQPILDTGISKIEKGTRAVDVDDLTALAVALDVTPNALLLPDVDMPDAVKTFPLTPQQAEGRPRKLWAWATGEEPLEQAAATATADSAVKIAALMFARQNRPHHFASDLPDWADGTRAAFVEDQSRVGTMAAQVSSAVGIIIMDAFRAGFTSTEVRDMVEHAITVSMTLAPDKLPATLEEVRAALVAAIDATGSAREQDQ
jgi:transcriptional regulator with XRE-family HTH domain